MRGACDDGYVEVLRASSSDALRNDNLDSMACLLKLAFAFYFADAGFQGLQGEVGLFLVDQQRRREADRVGASAENEQAFVEGGVDDGIAQIGCFFLGALVADDFHADHQTPATDVAYDFEFFGPVGHFGEEIVAHAAGILFVLRFDEVHRCQRSGDADRVAAEGCAVGAWLPSVHDAAARDERAEWHAAGDALGAAEDVGLDAGVLRGPPLPGAPHTGLYFVDDQHNAVLAANALQLLQEEFLRSDVATFALDWLDYDGGDFLGIEEALEDLTLERFEDFGAAGFGSVTVIAAV